MVIVISNRLIAYETLYPPAARTRTKANQIKKVRFFLKDPGIPAENDPGIERLSRKTDSLRNHASTAWVFPGSFSGFFLLRVRMGISCADFCFLGEPDRLATVYMSVLRGGKISATMNCPDAGSVRRGICCEF